MRPQNIARNKFMNASKKAEKYLKTFCSVKPNRSTGSTGNQRATSFFTKVIKSHSYQVKTDYFDCLDFRVGKTFLKHKNRFFEIYPSPFSLGYKVKSELITVSSVNELSKCNCERKILLMKGEICAEQLMPKNFIFYNPEHHKKIYSLLETKKPAVIITATEPKPALVGAIYPFPLIEDGDFDIPNCYCDKAVGDKLASYKGEIFELNMKAKRILTKACNVVARKNPQGNEKILIYAHIDARASTPGASDNASGVVVLLLLAEMLSDYHGDSCIEIVALNGEDHYSVAGQMNYLKHNQQSFNKIILSINIDDVGYKKGKTSYTLYQCSGQTTQLVKKVFSKHMELIEGEPWYNGDHMIFAQNYVETIALTSASSAFLMENITHTQKDKPDIINFEKLVEIAAALKDLILNFKLGRKT